MALTLTRIKNLEPQNGKPRRESDGGGLYIEATAKGSKLWKMAYRIGPKQKTLSFGSWPAVSIVEARAMREQAKKALAAGEDPGAIKKAMKAGGVGKTFDEWAGEFIEFRRASKHKPTAQSTLDKFEWSRQAVRRQFGGSPITDISVPQIIDAIRAIERTGKLHKSVKAKTFISQVFRFAAGSGIQVMDPGRIVSDAVMRPATRNHAAITDPKRFGELLRAIDEYSGDPSTLLALRLAPHVFLRDGAIRALKWAWVDAENAIIEIPAEAMKMKRPHLVPLSRQALDIVEEARQFSGRQEHVFPSAISRGRSISSNTLNVAIRRLGFSKDEMTFHGFRTTASTLLREIEGYGTKWTDRSIEAQLSHTDENKVRSAYDKSENLAERRVMLQAWSDQIDKSRSDQV